MSQKLVVETWGELGSIPGIKEIMPLETEVANAMKAEGVIEGLFVKDGASEEAYKTHLASPHFKVYKEGTPHMIKSLELVPMQPLDTDGMKRIFNKQ